MLKIEDKHLVISTGGTGGHFYPALAIAQAWVRCGGRTTMLIAGKHAEKYLDTAIRGEEDVKALPVPAPRLPRSATGLPGFLFAFWKARRMAYKWFKKNPADIVLGMGSFASAPACLGARKAGLPLILHEGNAWMGRANRWLSRFARVAAISVPIDPECKYHCQTVCTGHPLRKQILETASSGKLPEDYYERHNLDPERSTVLFFGGSQGANSVNKAIHKLIPTLAKRKDEIQFVHLTGASSNDSLEHLYERTGFKACVKESDPRIDLHFLAADLVVCRSGISSICELAMFGKPIILIPFPWAADNHQMINAKLIASEGAGWCLPESETLEHDLQDLINSFHDSPEPWLAMGEKLKTFARPDAIEKIIELIDQTASQG